MRNIEQSDRWVDSHDALDLLRVKRETLYAYVSRGHVRSKPKAGDHRACLYALSDLRRMAKKRRRPRKRSEVARSTIRWGEPILETRISTVINDRLIFGTLDACKAAETSTLEEIAAYHLQGEPRWTTEASPYEFNSPASSPLMRGFQFLTHAANEAAPLYKRTKAEICEEAARLLPSFADSLIGSSNVGPIHQRLSASWNLTQEQGEIVRQALVLISDHELNASTFAVRVTASTGASLPACALAGLCALSGPLHGYETERATLYLQNAMKALSGGQNLKTFIDENPAIPGMGHPLYPNGDIRAKHLIKALAPSQPVQSALDAFRNHTGHEPNIDMAHAALVHEFGLPKGAGLMIFAIGRMAGWLAHAIEQSQTGALIRPRATFNPAPSPV